MGRLRQDGPCHWSNWCAQSETDNNSLVLHCSQLQTVSQMLICTCFVTTQDLTPGQPARPMLAAVASSVEYAHSKLHGHAAVVETKFDGERMQVCRVLRVQC